MQYALLIYSGDDARAAFEGLGEDEQASIVREYEAINDTSAVIGAQQLQPRDTATTVRVADGKTLTTDGPFAETKDALGGFFLVEADDLDAALDVAARVPAARMGGAVEVRPVVER